jgi:BMFP domain-containing protein YqiC
MMAVIIFIALDSISDGSGARGARMLPVTFEGIEVQVPCQPRKKAMRAAAARKNPYRAVLRPDLGQSPGLRNKTGQFEVGLLGEAPVEIPRVEELLRSLMQGLPPGLVSGASGLREDMENNFRAILRANLARLDLAGREEFDAQRKVLERTRARLEGLEKRVAELEARASGSAGR